MKEQLLEYLHKKATELAAATTRIKNDRKRIREQGQYRTIHNLTQRIENFNNRSNSLQLLINLIRDTIEFSTNINNVSQYLSPFGTFYDRYTLFYDSNLINKYNSEHQIQILLCEIFNGLQDYYITSPMTDTLKTIYRGRSLLYMYYIGAISETISITTANEALRIKQFNDKYPLHSVITFEPNNSAAQYLLDKLLFDGDIKLGIIVENWEFDNSLTLKARASGICITESDGIKIVDSSNNNMRTFYFLKEGEQYIRSNSKNIAVKESQQIINVTKKITGE